MTPYLVRSSVAHVLIFAAVFIIFTGGASKKPTFYTIDFLGASAGATGSGTGPASAPATPAPETKKAEISKPGKPEPLPSLKRWLPKAKAATLKNAEMAVRSKNKNAPEAVEEPALMGTSRKDPAGAAGSSSPAGGSTGGGAPGATEVGTDLADFPYPWYLQRLRAAIWFQWSSRMPRGELSNLLRFTIARDGSVSAIEVAKASGSSDFDFNAMTAVKAAAPFPPLPDDFTDSNLRVNVSFQSLP